MAKRINISVPDFLYNKIIEWRESFNLSKIFQEAVEQAIARKEEFHKRMQRDFQLDEIVERLKKEKSHAEEGLFARGLKAGVEWATRAHYEELMTALKKPASELAKSGGMLCDYFARTGKKLCASGNDFLHGWEAGVHDFWQTVKDRVNAEQKKK